MLGGPGGWVEILGVSICLRARVWRGLRGPMGVWQGLWGLGFWGERPWGASPDRRWEAPIGFRQHTPRMRALYDRWGGEASELPVGRRGLGGRAAGPGPGQAQDFSIRAGGGRCTPFGQCDAEHGTLVDPMQQDRTSL